MPPDESITYVTQNIKINLFKSFTIKKYYPRPKFTFNPKYYRKAWKDIEKIILYRWNRKYPADFRFDINLEDSEWKLAETREFTGSSHEKITEEVYVRG